MAQLQTEEHTSQIAEQGVDYLLALKDDQLHGYEDVRYLLAWERKGKCLEMVHAQHTDTARVRGRIEVCPCATITDPECLARLANHAEWDALSTIVHLHTQRLICDRVSGADLCYLCGPPAGTLRLYAHTLPSTCPPSGIDVQFHWVLDVTSCEDYSCVRFGNPPCISRCCTISGPSIPSRVFALESQPGLGRTLPARDSHVLRFVRTIASHTD